MTRVERSARSFSVRALRSHHTAVALAQANCVDCVCGGQNVLDDIVWERERKRKSLLLHVAALEQIASIVGGVVLPDKLEDGSGLLHEMIVAALGSALALPDKGKIIEQLALGILNSLSRKNAASREVQRIFRGKVGRGKARVRRAHEMYVHERSSNLVRETWKKEQEKEVAKYKTYVKQQREAADQRRAEKLLSKSLRFGWVFIPERFSYDYYWHAKTKRTTYDRPTYSFLEYLAARKIQQQYRSKRARLLVASLRESTSDAERIARLRAVDTKLVRFTDVGFEQSERYLTNTREIELTETLLVRTRRFAPSHARANRWRAISWSRRHRPNFGGRRTRGRTRIL